jgi:hypothetical protein
MFGEKRCAYWVLMEKSEGRRPLGRLRNGRKDNIKMIKMDLWEVGWVAWTGLM